MFGGAARRDASVLGRVERWQWPARAAAAGLLSTAAVAAAAIANENPYYLYALAAIAAAGHVVDPSWLGIAERDTGNAPIGSPPRWRSLPPEVKREMWAGTQARLLQKMMELHPGYIYATGCEDEATEEKIRQKWNTKFGNTLWTSLYKEEPIIVINGHGGLINPKLQQGVLAKKRFIKVPEKTQLISFTRSGSCMSSGGYRFNNNTIDEDIKITTMNPHDESLYFLENDGIKRKSPYIYAPYINRNSFGVHCQKLYREDDIVNNLNIYFYDHNNAFNGDTGIFIYNSKIPVEEYLSHFRNLKQQYLQSLENDDLPTDIHNISFNEQMKARSKSPLAYDNIKLLDLLLNTDVEKLHPVTDSSRFNFKFLFFGESTTLYNIMSVIQDGTYYINSCKFGNPKTNEEIELARELSRRGDYPPALASQPADAYDIAVAATAFRA